MVQWAKIDWQDSTLTSSQFNDIYFSSADGFQESHYVFLQHNQLASRWAKLAPSSRFVIGEIGFGTGLNVLSAWQLWEKTAPASAHLEMICCEKYPVKPGDLQRALSHWPCLLPYLDRLMAFYQQGLDRGFQKWHLTSNVHLTLLIGDANHWLAQYQGPPVDAWFLDGFAPHKNPETWTPKIAQTIAQHSRIGTSFATFSVAACVKKTLANAGFALLKSKGYGRKRQMLSGHLETRSILKRPSYWTMPSFCDGKRVAVIGAGLAGCASAHVLANKGYIVTIYDAKGIAKGTSGNPAGILQPSLSVDFNASDQWYTQGFLRTRTWIKQHGLAHQACGALALLTKSSIKQRMQRVLQQRGLDTMIARWVGPPEASKIAGIKLNASAIYYPTACVVSPQQLCRQLINITNNITCQMPTRVTEITKTESGHWQCQDTKGKRAYYDHVIIANGDQAQQWIKNFPLYASDGQVSILKQSGLDLRSIVMQNHYCLPFFQGQQVMGASFRANDDFDGQVRLSDHLANEWQQHPDFKDQPWTGRVGRRCITSDHLPCVGPVVDYDAFKATFFSSLHKGCPVARLPQMPYQAGLYVVTGFGSKGLSSCLLAADCIAAMITGGALPISASVYQAIAPHRFWVRAFKKGQLK